MLALGVAVLAVWALLLGVNALILYGLRAPRLAYAGPLRGDFGVAQEVCLPTRNNKMLTGWFVATSGAAMSPAVVVMHGWGANASLMQGCLAPLHAAGLGVLLLDARCHGRSDAEPFTSLPRFAEDIEAGLAWLATQPLVDARRLAVIGHSVGAGAALLTATRHGEVRAVVSISAFAHPHEVMLRYLTSYRIPYPLLGWYVLRHVQRVIGARFDAIAPLRSITHISSPVLLVHGREDEMVPLDDARRLLAAGRPGSVQLLEVAGQHDLSTALDQHLPEITDFLQQALRPATAGHESSVSV
ncbi:alpha/beta hydrolase [Rhodoferax antarcticus]|uniref:Putative BAAT / Acyl-CoA thioester hydrolase C terminal family protein n=1 Tax=Rhodoferax antarcticus ANT.BR TaxID=1111071 RepID=A0A1Q8YBV9_9BURK|nr:alpha/beta fold hydrolase [Rhodoferax antarcticus]APW46604.1 dipeptidyl aminopeptidase [Rhodoferax antarcticus]OLP05475.1 putative BAAT / Acyl-CoA thioester hydrolase C terminal family protein [Rhodoferax antarcticus ANT.BR]